jgi:rhodanese-related sulfurtransferase
MDHSPAFLALVHDAKSRVQEVDVRGLERMEQDGRPLLIVDVREDNEWDAGHLDGAVHLGRGILERDVEKQIPDKSSRLVLYCGGGFRSALSADNLQKMGYTDVWSLDGGYKALSAMGRKIVR